MTTYVITIPGTFLREPGDAARSALVQALRPADPRQTALGEAEELDILTLEDDGMFSVRLEVEANDNHSAEADAKRVLRAALADAGFTQDDVPLGPAAVTGIDAGS